jgi:signal transduction histidine kinase
MTLATPAAAAAPSDVDAPTTPLLPAPAPPFAALVAPLLAAPSTEFAAAGWALALAALAAALLVRRGHDRRLALVAEAAHELRGPLCAARLGLHALESAAEPVAQRAAAVELELRRAGLALEDLQVAPRGRRTGERLEVVDAGALIGGAALGWSTVVRSHGARLRVERPAGAAPVRADRLRLAQALGNLVANAAEHGGGEVLVRAEVERDRVRIEVADHGPGLPAPVAEIVEARRAAHGPRGHGLAVALRVAERHGGRLLTAPSVRGARLVLDLPLARPEPPGRPPTLWVGWRRAAAAVRRSVGPTDPPATAPAPPPAPFPSGPAVPPAAGPPR